MTGHVIFKKYDFVSFQGKQEKQVYGWIYAVSQNSYSVIDADKNKVYILGASELRLEHSYDSESEEDILVEDVVQDLLKIHNNEPL